MNYLRFNSIYKVTSRLPVLWQMAEEMSLLGQRHNILFHLMQQVAFTLYLHLLILIFKVSEGL